MTGPAAGGTAGTSAVAPRPSPTAGLDDTALDDQVDRRVGWLMALGGATLALVAVLDLSDGWATMPPWWNTLGVVLLVLCVGPAVLGEVLPMSALRWCWRSTPLLYLVLITTWAFVCAPDAVDETLPWVWEIEAYAATVIILVLPWPAAAVYAAGTALVVPASAWLVSGVVPQDALARSAIHVGDVAFIAIFVAIRSRLRDLAVAERVAAAQERRRVAADAAAAEQARLATVVHDEILSTLATATRSRARSAAAVAQAVRALQVLDADATARGTGPVLVPVGRLADDLRARAEAIVPTAVLEIRPGVGLLPEDVAMAVLGATAEALRNAVRHARDPRSAAPVRVEVHAVVDRAKVEVEVRDDGPGFVPGSVGQGRLGVRHSIVDRMAALAHGSAVVDSAPGAGTRVVLRWSA
jgi:signal transduction histidine kinase